MSTKKRLKSILLLKSDLLNQSYQVVRFENVPLTLYWRVT